MTHPEAARLSFELVQALTEEGPDNAVVPDNFSGLLTVLDDFATMAGLVQEQQQPRGRRAEPLSVAKHVSLLCRLEWMG
jgi:brefeldin A-resistance guanine nucleotide exchange factor 1